MNHFQWVLIVGGLSVASSLLASDDSQKELMSPPTFTWPSTIEEGSTGVIRQEEVLQILQQLFPKDDIESVFDVGSFRFAPLEQGKMYLVASTDVIGRGSYNKIQIVYCQELRCRVLGAVSDGEVDLQSQVVDVDGDGNYELIVKTLVGDYEGALTRPIYTYAIMARVNNELNDVSDKHREWFQANILPRMATDRKHVEAMLRAIKTAPANVDGRASVPEQEQALGRHAKDTKSWPLKARAELQYAQDEYRRRVLGEKQAGMEHALTWSRSSEPELQLLSIGVLKELPANVVVEPLQRLAHATDGRVAAEARRVLEEKTTWKK